MQLSRRSVVDISLLVLVNTMWAAQYAAYKVASRNMGPITVSAWTFLIAALVLLPFLLWERQRTRMEPVLPKHTPAVHDPMERSFLKKRNMLGFVMIGVVGLIPGSVLLAWGEMRTTASNASLIYLTVPIITALMASVILREKMTWVRWISLVISIVGVLILSGVNLSKFEIANSKFLIGDLLVLGACTSSSFYNVYCKELLRRFTALEVLVFGYLVAIVLSIPLMVGLEGFSPSAVTHYKSNTWIALIVLSVFSWGLAMVLWMFLLTRLDVSQASVSIYLLPFLGVLISAVTLHEKITAAMVIGGLITLAGTILITATESSTA